MSTYLEDGRSIRAIPLRSRSQPTRVPMMDLRNWYKLATADIVDYSSGINPSQSFIHIRGVNGPIVVPVPVDWLDREYARATVHEFFFRDETDMSELSG